MAGLLIRCSAAFGHTATDAVRKATFRTNADLHLTHITSDFGKKKFPSPSSERTFSLPPKGPVLFGENDVHLLSSVVLGGSKDNPSDHLN